MNIGKAIQSRRKTANLAVPTAAAAASVSVSYWEKLEAGVMKNPSISILQRIAGALGCDIPELLKEFQPAQK